MMGKVAGRGKTAKGNNRYCVMVKKLSHETFLWDPNDDVEIIERYCVCIVCCFSNGSNWYTTVVYLLRKIKSFSLVGERVLKHLHSTYTSKCFCY